MKHKIGFFTLLSALVLMGGSCTSREERTGDVVFTRADFKETKALTDAEEIEIDSLLYPASFRVLDDTVLVVGNQPVCEYQLELYSLNTLQPLAQLVRKGNGPEEMLSCGLCLNSNCSRDFYLRDMATQTCYAVNLDSLLKRRRFVPLSSFRYSSEVLMTSDIYERDSAHYVGCHMWYSPDERYSNGVEAPLAVFRKGEESGKDMFSYRYFTGEVLGACLFPNREDGTLWAADMHRDRISVYDDSLNVVFTLTGPDHFQMGYEVIQSNSPIPFVSFTGGRNIHAYVDYFLTDKHIYLLYEGTEHFDPIQLSPVEMFKLDYKGNLLCRYQFDRYVYSISVDRSEQHLYCASRKTLEEPPVVLKYAL